MEKQLTANQPGLVSEFALPGSENLTKLIDNLNQLTITNQLSTTANFAVFGQDHQSSQPTNYIFADYHTGLLARLRPKDQVSAQQLNHNLELVNQAILAGAPLVPPVRCQTYSLANYTATFWQLGHNRPITALEMATTLHDIHQVTALPQLPDHLASKYLIVTDKLQTITGIPDQLLTEVRQYIKQATERLLTLYSASPKRLVHGDGHPANFIELDSQIVACDADDLASGPPEADLVTPLFHARYYPQADRQMGQKLIAAYPAKINLELLEAFVVVKALKRLCDAGTVSPALFEQRWQAILTNQPFTNLVGAECHTYFAD